MEIWYLMGAWLLGATMNALMTWWAVSLTLLDHELGNEILNRQQLLEVVPVFVAVLVWLTRILFIGAFTVAGGYLFESRQKQPAGRPKPKAERAKRRGGVPDVGKHMEPVALRHNRRGPRHRPARAVSGPSGLHHVTDEIPSFLREREPVKPNDERNGEAAEQPPSLSTGNSHRRDNEKSAR